MLRSVFVDRTPRPASRTATVEVRRIGAVFIAASAVALGGCSTDFLRFDAPVFSLNDDANAGGGASTALAGRGYGGGASLGDSRTAGYTQTGEVARGDLEPVTPAPAAVPRRMAALDAGQSSGRQPIAATPLATGALGQPGTITVQPGDTLYQLSRRHGVGVGALRDANGLTGNTIHPGQVLRLPWGPAAAGSPAQAPRRVAPTARASAPPRVATGARTVAVAPGDSLYAISRRTGVSVADLKRFNGIVDARRLQPGQVLALDGAAGPGDRSTRVASRTDFGQPAQPRTRTPDQGGLIPTRSIRTVAIGRDMAAPSPRGPASAEQPRILNGDGRAVGPTTGAAHGAREAAALADDDTAADTSKFRWPARGRIIAPFNQSGQGVKNDGIKISLPIGTPIQAVESGTVAYAGSELKGYGNLILLRHANGWVSAYAHASELLVKRGDKVERGQVIAKAGRSGGVTQPQLHFELRREAQPVDPLPHLAAL